MRAISAFSLEAGTSTFGWRAWIALRTRVSMSAMGSVVIVLLLRLLPARFDHARNLAIERELPEAQAANAEFPQKRPRTAAAPATVAVLAAQPGRLIFPGLLELQVLRDFGGCSHIFLVLLCYCRNGIPICFSKATPSASV